MSNYHKNEPLSVGKNPKEESHPTQKSTYAFFHPSPSMTASSDLESPLAHAMILLKENPHFQRLTPLKREQILGLLLSPNGVATYKEGLWNEKQILNGIRCGMNVNILAVLMSDQGVYFWKQVRPYLRMDQLVFFYHPRSLELLLSPNGIKALKEKLITPEQANNLHPIRLSLLLSNNGIKALQKQWVTIEQAMRTNLQTLEVLLSDEGIQAFNDFSIEITHISKVQASQKMDASFFTHQDTQQKNPQRKSNYSESEIEAESPPTAVGPHRE